MPDSHETELRFLGLKLRGAEFERVQFARAGLKQDHPGCFPRAIDMRDLRVAGWGLDNASDLIELLSRDPTMERGTYRAAQKTLADQGHEGPARETYRRMRDRVRRERRLRERPVQQNPDCRLERRNKP
jgi:hypothetical protein